MGMSAHVVGFRPPDEKWKKMRAIWESCEAAEVDIPKDVIEYFDGVEPDESGVTVDLAPPCLTEWLGEYENGYQVDVSKLPKDVKIIRFYNSY